MLKSISSHHLSLLNIEAEADVNQIQSQAEKTIHEHNSRDATHNRILVKGNDGLLYPKNPDTDYISRFPNRFRGCLSCDSIDYVNCACPQRANSDMKQNSLRIFEHMYLPLGRPCLLLTLCCYLDIKRQCFVDSN